MVVLDGWATVISTSVPLGKQVTNLTVWFMPNHDGIENWMEQDVCLGQSVGKEVLSPSLMKRRPPRPKFPREKKNQFSGTFPAVNNRKWNSGMRKNAAREVQKQVLKSPPCRVSQFPCLFWVIEIARKVGDYVHATKKNPEVTYAARSKIPFPSRIFCCRQNYDTVLNTSQRAIGQRKTKCKKGHNWPLPRLYKSVPPPTR